MMSETTSQVAALRKILCIVDGSPPEPGPSQTLVHYDLRSGTVVAKRPPLLTWPRQVRTYRVTADQWVEFPQRAVNISGGDSLRSLEVDLRYRLACPKDNEQTVITLLARDNDPAATLDSVVNAAVVGSDKRFISAGRDLLIEFFDLKEAWEGEIKRRIQAETGLAAEVTLYVGESSLEGIRFHSEPSPVAVTDYRREELSFSASMRLEVDDRALAMSRIREREKMEREILEQLRQTINENCTIRQFCFADAEFEGLLERKAESVARDYGRQVAQFKWKPRTPWRLPKLKDAITHQHSCRIKGCPDDIEVKHDVLMQLQDIPKYLRLEQDNIDTWTKETLERITQAELFNREFVDVAINFKPTIEELIRKQMESEAEQFGLVIKHISSLPNIEPLKLREGFQFHVDGEFSTRNTRVKVKLNVVGNGRVSDLEKIKQYLRPGKDLVHNYIEPAVVQVTQDILHGMTPHRFYLHFQHASSSYPLATAGEDAEGLSDRAKPAEEKSVEHELTQQIRQTLEERFAVEDCHIVVKQVDTELTERLRHLLNATPHLSFNVKPRGGAEMTLHAAYRILGVVPDCWDVFQEGIRSPAEEIQAISELVIDRATQIMAHNIPIELLRYDSNEGRNRLERAVFGGYQSAGGVSTEGVNAVVERTHGLFIDVTAFRRDTTDQELLRVERTDLQLRDRLDLERGEIDQLKAVLARLHERELRLIESSDPDDPDLAAVREEMESVKVKIDELSGPTGVVAPLTERLLEQPVHEDEFVQELLPAEERRRLTHDSGRSESKEAHDDADGS